MLTKTDFDTSAQDANRQGLLLCVAAACGLDDLAKLLLEYGCDPEAVLVAQGWIGRRLDRDKQISACAWAAAFGDVKVIELLLSHGADRDRPLFIAVEREQLDAVRLLLREYGGKCCVQLLYSAIEHPDIFRLLLEHGVDFENKEEEISLFMTAIQSGKVAIVEVLLDFGFTRNNITHPTFTAATGGIDMLELLLQHHLIPPLSEDEYGDKAMKHAVDTDNIPLLKYLHSHGCSIDPWRYDEYLKGAIYADNFEIFENMLDELLRYGVDINATTGIGRRNCFWNAIRGREASRFKVLLEKGADPLHRSCNRDESPLEYATCTDFSEGIKVLLPEIASRVSREELVCQIKKCLEIARSHRSPNALRVLERAYYWKLPEKV